MHSMVLIYWKYESNKLLQFRINYKNLHLLLIGNYWEDEIYPRSRTTVWSVHEKADPHQPWASAHTRIHESSVCPTGHAVVNRFYFYLQLQTDLRHWSFASAVVGWAKELAESFAESFQEKRRPVDRCVFSLTCAFQAHIETKLRPRF